MNRGLARRTVFETRQDARFFLSLLAREVRRGRIRIVSYAILSTHFHLLLESTTGELSGVMQRVQNLYVRYFNRTRRRDGPLFRSRFLSKPVRSERYATVLVRYIDQNALDARLVTASREYPFCSAFHLTRRRRPPWLWGEWIDARIGRCRPTERALAYQRRFGRDISSEECAVIELRLSTAAHGDDCWDSLVGAAPSRVMSWMLRKARLADGTKPGLPYVAASRVLAVVAEESRGLELRCTVSGTRKRDAWPVLTVGLLRELAGLTYAAITRYTNCTASTATKRQVQHRYLMVHDPEYRSRCANVASKCLG